MNETKTKHTYLSEPCKNNLMHRDVNGLDLIKDGRVIAHFYDQGSIEIIVTACNRDHLFEDMKDLLKHTLTWTVDRATEKDIHALLGKIESESGHD